MYCIAWVLFVGVMVVWILLVQKRSNWAPIKEEILDLNNFLTLATALHMVLATYVLQTSFKVLIEQHRH